MAQADADGKEVYDYFVASLNGDEPLSIDAVVGNECNEECGALYDLAGRRVVSPVKNGIYISNGKKVIGKCLHFSRS